MEVFTARQAILSAKNKVVGYELLYREGEDNRFPKGVDPHQATNRIVVRNHLNTGVNELTGGHRAFINFTEKCLLSGLPELLPKDKVVVEILETVRPTREVYECCRKLFKAGYILALDDFVHKKEWEPFLKLTKIIKFDISRTPLNTLVPTLKRINDLRRQGNLKNKLHYLAERVETKEEFEKAKKMGFSFFQGYYFCKPEIHVSKDVDMSAGNLMILYKEILKEEIDQQKIAKCFEQDEALTYKLLQYMNSGVFSIVNEISSIKQALSYLGEANIRQFVTLLCTSEIATLNGKPAETLRLGIVRAKTCENTAKKVAPGQVSSASLSGLLSVLPGILDRPMEAILKQLPVAKEINDALLPKPGEKEGILQIILKATTMIEAGKWHDTTKECMKIRISFEQMEKFHHDAIVWSQQYEQNVGVGT